MQVYKGLTREELEAQYYLRGTRPSYEVTDIPRWLEQSKRFVANAEARLDIAYGPSERNKLDFFPAGQDRAPFVLYIHGGYWQRGDKSVYSFLAEPLVNRGISVALMNYPLCPDVPMAEIAPQARLAVAWLWQHAEDLGISRDNFNVMGHSAGGHLTVEMIFTDWPGVRDGLPRELLHAGVALSGTYDFEPILYCSENEGLRMDAEEARAVSPLYREPATDTPQLVAYGANEPPELGRQSRDYVAKFQDRSSRMECFAVPEADHFEMVSVLGDDSSELFARAAAFFAP